MPKVSELIKDSIWKNSDNFYSFTPEVTVILPTYSRGDNGLFEACIKSILNQTFKNFELIIIDDGSFDSTQEHIKKFIQNDDRIAWIRHPKNIGLPALSCNEAYLKARAHKIFYAFDDNEYEPDAIEVLYNYHNDNPEVKVCYSATKVLTPNGNIEILGSDDFDIEKLWFGNNIPNGTVLVDKEVFETVGLYDSHISITRLCDWDIWLRIGQRFHIYRIDKILSTEKGPIQSDSLWYTHHRDYQLILEWMATNRNKALKPENFPDYDVTHIPKNISYLSKTKILNLLNKNFKWLMDNNNCSSQDMSLPDNGYILVLSKYNSLFLQSELNNKIILINQYDHYLKNAIDLYLNASAVVFTEYINSDFKYIAQFLRELRIPYYYFAAEFTKNNTKFIKNANAILCSSEKFTEQYNKLNTNSIVFNIESRDEVLKSILKKHSPEGILEYVQRVNYMTLFKTNLLIIKTNFKNLNFVFRKTIEHYWNKYTKKYMRQK